MKLNSLIYLQRVGIDLWVEKTQAKELRNQGGSKSSIAVPDRSSQSEDVTTKTPQTTSRWVTTKAESDLPRRKSVAEATRSAEAIRQYDCEISMYQNLVVIRSRGSVDKSAQLQDVSLVLNRYEVLSGEEHPFVYPPPGRSVFNSDDLSVTSARTGFESWLKRHLARRFGQPTRSVSFLVVGLDAIELSMDLELAKGQKIELKTLPTNATENGDLWRKIQQLFHS